jgi:hypothetical protein
MPNRTVIATLVFWMATAHSGGSATIIPVQGQGWRRQGVPPATGDTIPAPATGDKISHKPMATHDEIAIKTQVDGPGSKRGDKKGDQPTPPPPH